MRWSGPRKAPKSRKRGRRAEKKRGRIASEVKTKCFSGFPPCLERANSGWGPEQQRLAPQESHISPRRDWCVRDRPSRPWHDIVT
jgi:hypothetical protein